MSARYPAYKDSGVVWLGEVPEHWAVMRLKHNLKLLTEKTERREHPVALENIESWSGRFIETETEFEGDGVAFERGDILFGKLRPYLAKAYLAETAGEAVGDFHVMRPLQTVDGRFAQYQILNRDFINIVDGSTFGAKMPRASWNFFCNMALATPPKTEQQAIAAFLDRETRKIDALVAEQEKLIRLLREKRQAVISHAVTKGINPAAPMKDSGIGWLGEVPEHWEVKPVKAVASCNDEVLEESTPEDYEIEYIEISGVDASRGITSTEVIPFGVAPSRARRRVTDGDVLVSTIRTYLRAIAPINNPPANMIASTGFAVIRPRYVASQFLGYLFQAEFLISEVIAYSVGVSYPAINSSDLMRLKVPVPPSVEQTAITSFLDRETAKLDALTAEAQRGIELLKERRSALISAAVTGKIDVRTFSQVLEAA
jgi:type I restriction enzyme S subunit